MGLGVQGQASSWIRKSTPIGWGTASDRGLAGIASDAPSNYREWRATIGRGSEGDGLLIWGGVDQTGQIDLEPAFALEGPLSRPDDNGRFLAEGFGANGERVFSHRFTPDDLSHSDARMFSVIVPHDPLLSPRIHSITVSGPGSAMTMTDDHPPVAIIFNTGTGKVQAIRRNWQGDTPPGTRAIWSTGLPPRELIRR